MIIKVITHKYVIKKITVKEILKECNNNKTLIKIMKLFKQFHYCIASVKHKSLIV